MDKDALIASLQKLIETQAEQLDAQNKQLKQQAVQLEKMNQQIEQLLRTLYGKKSEKSSKKRGDDDDNNLSSVVELKAPQSLANGKSGLSHISSKPSLFGTTFLDRFLERLMDYVLYSLPLIIMAFAA